MKKKPAADPEPPTIPIRENRGQRVLLDSDLAAIYGVETKFLNRAVKRNAARFPSDFLFQLTQEEFDALRCQIGTLNAATPRSQIATLEISPEKEPAKNSSQIAMSDKAPPAVPNLISQVAISKPGRGQHRKYLPYAFTEYGALQAANILRSPRAVAMGVFVIRAFVQMRATFLQSDALAKKLAELEARLTGRLDTHEHAIVHVMQQLVQLLAPTAPPPRPPKPKIGFKT